MKEQKPPRRRSCGSCVTNAYRKFHSKALHSFRKKGHLKRIIGWKSSVCRDEASDTRPTRDLYIENDPQLVEFLTKPYVLSSFACAFNAEVIYKVTH
jgi:hypothetical protein